LTQLRNRGVDLDKVSHCRARQDGKLLDKTQNTKYAAQQIADIIHSWVPTRTADPDTQHELTQLRSQLAQLAKELGKIQATLPHHNGSFSI
jgi:Flp pilus assembly CpaE family ATPase